MGAVGQLTRARLLHHPTRWLLLVLGVALALALPVLAAATGHIVAGQALANAIEALPPGERTVIASYGGNADPSAQAQEDTRVRGELSRLTTRPVERQLLFGELADGNGTRYRLAASSGLAHQVRLTSGRLPVSCTPTRCEVLLTGDGTPPALDGSLGLVVVGTGERTDPLLLPGTFDPGPAAVALLGSDPDSLQQLVPLEQFPRGSGWVAALDPQRITSLGVSAYADLSREVGDTLALSMRALVLSVPDDALLREDARASASQGRFALLGGATAVLALGFVLVAAVGLRREHREVARLLESRGASRRSLVAFAIAGTGSAVAVGALLGAVVGWSAAVVAAGRQTLGPGATSLAWSAVLDALPVLAVLGVVAVGLTATVLLWPTSGSAIAWHVVELLAVVVVAMAVLVAARGAVGVATVGGDPLSTALPVLSLVAAALVAARLWLPLAAWVSRRLPSRAVAARLATAGGVHRPLRTVVTVGFVTAAVGTVVFAGAYRSTLAAGSADTAAFEVPLDARITVGPNGDSPLDLAVASPIPGTAFPVVRGAAGVRTSATSGDAVAVLGVDTGSLAAISRWDRTVGASDPATAARALATAPGDVGLALPDSAVELSIPVVAWTRTSDEAVDVVAWISTPDGRERGITLVLKGSTLSGALPELGPGRALTAITLRENPADAARHQHQVGEGGASTALVAGDLTLDTPSGASGGWSTWSSRTAEVDGSATRLSIGYQLSGPLVVVRPGLASRPPVPVLADPETAARATSLRLDLGGGEAAAATVVGVLPRFPTTGTRFLVADRTALAAVLDDHEPGSGAARELWVDDAGDATSLAGRLHAAPYDRVVVVTQADRLVALESDAVSQGAGWLLLVAAALSLLVALVSLVLLVTGERRDDEGQLLAHEADGVSTSTLRRSLWLRAIAVAVPALVAGTIAGLVLSRSVSSLVALSAGGTTPTPPLIPAVGPGWTASVLLGGFVVALAACALVAGRMLRGEWPGRPEQDLR